MHSYTIKTAEKQTLQHFLYRITALKKYCITSTVFSCLLLCFFLLMPASGYASQKVLRTSIREALFPIPNTPVPTATYNSKPIQNYKQQQMANRAFELAVFYYTDNDYHQMWQYLNQASVYNHLYAQTLSLIAQYKGLGCARNKENAEYGIIAVRKELIQQAEEGSLTAMWLVGILYQDGIFVAQNQEKAVEWFETARRESKNTTALAPKELAGRYSSEQGRYADISKDKAIQLLQEAAENGALFAYIDNYFLLNTSGKGNAQELQQECLTKALSYAESTFTHMFAKDIKTVHNEKTYVQFLLQTAHRGFAPSQHALALLYAKPEYPFASPLLAKQWMHTAAAFGNVQAQEALALHFLAETSIPEAMYWARAAVQQDYPEIQTHLAELLIEHPVYLDNKKTLIEQWLLRAHHLKYAPASLLLAQLHERDYFKNNSSTTALLFYEQAAKNGSPEAAYKTAQNILLNNPGKTQTLQAIKYLEMAAEHDNADALFMLAKLYDYGVRILHDNEKALHYYTQAASLSNNPEHFFDVGMLYFSGRLTPQDFRKAAFYFKLAAKHDYVPAWYHLGLTALEELKSSSVRTNTYSPLFYFYKAYHLGSIESAYQIGALFENLSIAADTEHEEFFEQLLASDFETAEILLNQKRGYSPTFIRNEFGAALVPMDNIVEAFNWYKRGAKEDIRAKKAAALLIFNHPDIFPRHYDIMFNWLEELYKSNKDPEIAYALASIYADTTDDYYYDIDTAINLYTYSAEQGFSKSYVALGDIFTSADLKKAMTYYQKGAYAGNAMAQLRLAEAFAYGSNKSLILAEHWFKAASSHKTPEAAPEAAFAYAKFLLRPANTTPSHKDIYTTVSLLNKALEQGHYAAAGMLGELYQHNMLVPANSGIAFLYYSIAAKYNEPKALYALSQMYAHADYYTAGRFGFFVEKDIIKAAQLARVHKLPYLGDTFYQAGRSLYIQQDKNTYETAAIGLMEQATLLGSEQAFFTLIQLYLNSPNAMALNKAADLFSITYDNEDARETVTSFMESAFSRGKPVPSSYAVARSNINYLVSLARITGSLPYRAQYPTARIAYLDSLIRQPTVSGMLTDKPTISLYEKNQALKEITTYAKARYFKAEIRLAYYYLEGVYLEEAEQVFRNAYVNAWKSIGKEFILWIKAPACKQAFFLHDAKCVNASQYEILPLFRILF